MSNIDTINVNGTDYNIGGRYLHYIEIEADNNVRISYNLINNSSQQYTSFVESLIDYCEQKGINYTSYGNPFPFYIQNIPTNDILVQQVFIDNDNNSYVYINSPVRSLLFSSTEESFNCMGRNYGLGIYFYDNKWHFTDNSVDVGVYNPVFTDTVCELGTGHNLNS